MRPWAFLAAAIAALLVTAGAEAASAKTVKDPRFDTSYLSRHGRVDITKASAKRRLGTVRHSVTMRARVRPARARETASITINTRGGRRSAYELIVFRSTIFRVQSDGDRKAVGDAKLTVKRRTWRYRFDLDEVRGLGAGYGWAAVTQKRNGRFADVAPDGGYVKSP
ncbi:MAG TPA: hypothetical protein VFH44_03425 [Solirubrobacterales bacterium]|nr:hypothetical protein [Solirubrobacterales bacterium]